MIGYIITALISATFGYFAACLMVMSGRQSDFEDMDKLLDSNAMLKAENERLQSELYIAQMPKYLITVDYEGTGGEANEIS